MDNFQVSQQVQECAHPDEKLKIIRNNFGGLWQVRCKCKAIWSLSPIGEYAKYVK